jgi:outer membrane lipoprotein carrier protein
MSGRTRQGRGWQALAPALLCALLWGLPAHSAPPPRAHSAQPREGVNLLETYLDGLTTLRANFVQTVADSQGKEIDRDTGTLIIVRPGKFSWEIHPPKSAAGSSGGELVVADGRNVWHLDRDLDQVTVKPVDEALSATPAMLMSGTVDLRKSFNVSPAGKREGLDWVMVEPTAAQAEFRSALFGFDHQDLARLILENKLGQVVTIYFDQLKRNGPVSPGEVSFTPPPGTDVIGKPR